MQGQKHFYASVSPPLSRNRAKSSKIMSSSCVSSLEEEKDKRHEAKPRIIHICVKVTGMALEHKTL